MFVFKDPTLRPASFSRGVYLKLFTKFDVIIYTSTRTYLSENRIHFNAAARTTGDLTRLWFNPNAQHSSFVVFRDTLIAVTSVTIMIIIVIINILGIFIVVRDSYDFSARPHRREHAHLLDCIRVTSKKAKNA